MREVEIGLVSIQAAASRIWHGKGVSGSVGTIEPHVMARPSPVCEVNGAAARDGMVFDEVRVRYVGDDLSSCLDWDRRAEKSA